MGDQDQIETVELTESNLMTPAAAEMLGAIAVSSLKEYGQVTFVVRPDGGVAFANPTHVHIHPQAVPDLAERPYRAIRPILGTGRPPFVVWKNGVLWEVEFLDEKPQKNSGV